MSKLQGSQVKVVLPTWMYERLSREAETRGVTMADLVRIAVAENYERRDQNQKQSSQPAPQENQ